MIRLKLCGPGTECNAGIGALGAGWSYELLRMTGRVFVCGMAGRYQMPSINALPATGSVW
jgi:hypothetical protein